MRRLLESLIERLEIDLDTREVELDLRLPPWTLAAPQAKAETLCLDGGPLYQLPWIAPVVQDSMAPHVRLLLASTLLMYPWKAFWASWLAREIVMALNGSRSPGFIERAIAQAVSQARWSCILSNATSFCISECGTCEPPRLLSIKGL